MMKILKRKGSKLIQVGWLELVSVSFASKFRWSPLLIRAGNSMVLIAKLHLIGAPRYASLWSPDWTRKKSTSPTDVSFL